MRDEKTSCFLPFFFLRMKRIGLEEIWLFLNTWRDALMFCFVQVYVQARGGNIQGGGGFGKEAIRCWRWRCWLAWPDVSVCDIIHIHLLFFFASWRNTPIGILLLFHLSVQL